MRVDESKSELLLVVIAVVDVVSTVVGLIDVAVAVVVDVVTGAEQK